MTRPLLLILLLTPLAHASDTVTPLAAAQTHPVPHKADAADDPAIWIHPTDPEKSLVLGTDKQGGLIIYDLAGRQLQIASPDCQPNNVDILYDFPLTEGRNVDLAIASTRGLNEFGVKVWIIHPLIRRLEDVTANGAIRVFKRTVPYGICTYRSAKTGKHYFIVNNKSGQVEQYELHSTDGKTIDARLVRSLKLPSQLEGAVADHELGHLYLGEETKGVWKLGAEPDSTDKPRLIIKAGENGLRADVEGLCIYTAKGGKGYLIVSSQGNNTFKIYRREGDNEFVMTIDPKSGDIDDVNDTDGIDVTHRPCGDAFPKGFLVVQDGSNGRRGEKNQNFKLYKWEDIATDRLTIDTSIDPRR